MSKRLRVVMDDVEFAEVEMASRREGTTVSQWVRQTLREARHERPSMVRSRKLAVIRNSRNAIRCAITTMPQGRQTSRAAMLSTLRTPIGIPTNNPEKLGFVEGRSHE